MWFLLWAAAFLAGSPRAPAHGLFTAYIQHRVVISMGAQHVDVTVQLTFFEDGSEHERQRIDTDGDGRLSRPETDAYLQALESELAKAVCLRIGETPTPLTPLRAAELDLLGQDRVGRGHHRLTLYYFASTPTPLPAGTEVLVEDRLWPDVRALGSLQVEGKEGCGLEALPASDPIHPPARAKEARCFKARVLSPPVPPARATAGGPRQVSPQRLTQPPASHD
jgi:hypothetical protein